MLDFMKFAKLVERVVRRERLESVDIVNAVASVDEFVERVRAVVDFPVYLRELSESYGFEVRQYEDEDICVRNFQLMSDSFYRVMVIDRVYYLVYQSRRERLKIVADIYIV